mgnify:CR=1 FL=1
MKYISIVFKKQMHKAMEIGFNKEGNLILNKSKIFICGYIAIYFNIEFHSVRRSEMKSHIKGLKYINITLKIN